jgi:hypothetical protein
LQHQVVRVRRGQLQGSAQDVDGFVDQFVESRTSLELDIEQTGIDVLKQVLECRNASSPTIFTNWRKGFGRQLRIGQIGDEWRVLVDRLSLDSSLPIIVIDDHDPVAGKSDIGFDALGPILIAR